MVRTMSLQCTYYCVYAIVLLYIVELFLILDRSTER